MNPLSIPASAPQQDQPAVPPPIPASVQSVPKYNKPYIKKYPGSEKKINTTSSLMETAKNLKSNVPQYSKKTPAPYQAYLSEYQNSPPMLELRLNPNIVDNSPAALNSMIQKHNMDQYAANIQQGMLYPDTSLPYIGYSNRDPNITKKYNVIVNNVSGNISQSAQIYEDILPTDSKSNPYTCLTCNERHIMHDFIKNILNFSHEGEYLHAPSNEIYSGSILSDVSELDPLLFHIKITGVNQYHYNWHTKNPYKTIPKDFIMYKAAYPVRYNETMDTVEKAKNSMSLNIRVYRLKVVELLYLVDNYKKYYSDITNELHYYTFVRKNILYNKECPSFIFMHTWYLCDNTSIDFETHSNLVSEYDEETMPDITSKRAETLSNETLELLNKVKPNYSMVNTKCLKDKILQGTLSKEKEIKYVSEYTNRCLVMVTESPKYNIYNWASKMYDDDGQKMVMVHSGYHVPQTWYSIFLQLIFALITMNSNQIYIPQMSLERNVYITVQKNTQDVCNGYWRYVFCNTYFYVPCCGYVVVIDTCFSKAKDEGVSVEIGKCLSVDDICKLFDKDQFGRNFISNGGLPPSEPVMRLMDFIHHEFATMRHKPNLTKDDFYGVLIEMAFYLTNLVPRPIDFLHHRIGKYLFDNENYLKTKKTDFMRGDLVVYENIDSEPVRSQICMIIKIEGPSATIVTRDTRDQYTIQKVSLFELTKLNISDFTNNSVATLSSLENSAPMWGTELETYYLK
ncbi:hypothetical protein nvc1_031 [Namao virus]|nr:hypothetical protein nvc1_031 [Namao virus]